MKFIIIYLIFLKLIYTLELHICPFNLSLNEKDTGGSKATVNTGPYAGFKYSLFCELICFFTLLCFFFIDFKGLD